ncbi:MAG: alpha/beta fold hydrolase, partial [Planctomycetaceae bacterium]|nr:alpha/beta fold hydrolase [Planctomycetaceae bacterium]
MSPWFRNLSWTASLAALSLCAISIRAADEKPPVSDQPSQVDFPDKGQADDAEIDLQGKWLGEINLVSQKLRLGFVIEQRADNEWTGKLYSIDQGNMEIPLTEIKRDGKNITFVVKSIAGRFDGQWYSDSGKLAGFWKQGLVPLPLTLKRVEQLPALRRPQNPQPPYPYVEKEISFKNGVHQIALNGTLTLPQGPGPFPAAVLISGSGPQDRNEELMGHRPFLVLADALTRRGIAVLRFDDRDFGKPQEVFKTTSAELSEDAAAAVDYLKTRAEIDPKKIGLIGHSEGGMIAPMLAARRQEIAFVVMLAGPGIIGEKTMLGQSAAINKLLGVEQKQIEQNLSLS